MTKQIPFLPLLTLLLSVATFPSKTARAAAGDLYETEFTPQTVVRFAPDGTRTPFASGLNGADGLAFDRFGNLFVGLNSAGTIIKITPSGTQTTFASGLDHPAALAFDSDGFLFVAENFAGNIVKYAPDGTKFPFASALSQPTGLAFDLSGNLFVTEHGSGTNDVLRFAKFGGKTVFATAVDTPNGLAVDKKNNVYVSTSTPLGSTTGKILKFTPAGARTTFASGLTVPYGMAFDSVGNLFAADRATNAILKFTPAGAQTTFAANATSTSFLAFEPPLGQMLNISTRVDVQTGDNVLIGGFINTGTVGKKVLIRAIGPSLANANVAGSLQDPTLEVRGPNGTLIASNDNWKTNDQTHQSQQAQIAATGIPPADDRESALLLELGPDAFTAIVAGKNDATGIGLVEVYDLNPDAGARLANISTRGFAGEGNTTMIAGFIVGSGNGAAKVVVRVLGPSLAAAGVQGTLSDPQVSVRDSNGTVVASNDDWKVRDGPDFTNSQQAEIEATGIPPQNDAESAVVATLPAGNYTAAVQPFRLNAPSPTGIAVIEVYNLR
jgi:sugar lactone lactonase YvrE